MPALLDIIVPQGTSKAQIDGIVLHQRPTRQHALLATKATSTHADLPVLPAEVALADLWVHGELEAISPTPEQRQSAEACAFEIGLKKPNKNR